MPEIMELFPGITLRCYKDTRFKHGAMSVQLVRPMCKEEAALNALLPSVLLRGCEEYTDLRAITLRLDDLYGASVSALVRRVGDYQTTGLYCSFIDDRFALSGDRIVEPVIHFMGELLFRPVLEKGVFSSEYVRSEKKNLIATIEARRNDKRLYANNRLIQMMCREDSFGIPRLGDVKQVKEIDPETLYAHYRKILRESRIEIFYVGSAEAETVAQWVCPLFQGRDRNYMPLPMQKAYQPIEGAEETEEMEVSQGKLAMGFVTPITLRSEEFVAMQLMNAIFGGSMTNKLFVNIREKMSLCYDIGSGYHGSKGIVTVSAGIDFQQFERVRREVMNQIADCKNGEISEEELLSAKETILSGLRGTHDSPGSIEGYYSTAALSGLKMTPAAYMAAVEQVTMEQVVAAAQSVQFHSIYFLKGAEA